MTSSTRMTTTKSTDAQPSPNQGPYSFGLLAVAEVYAMVCEVWPLQQKIYNHDSSVFRTIHHPSTPFIKHGRRFNVMTESVPRNLIA
ncbi:hypothetical protein AB1N83_001197 [Pleurotus pulmonarius]